MKIKIARLYLQEILFFRIKILFVFQSLWCSIKMAFFNEVKSLISLPYSIKIISKTYELSHHSIISQELYSLPGELFFLVIICAYGVLIPFVLLPFSPTFSYLSFNKYFDDFTVFWNIVFYLLIDREPSFIAATLNIRTYFNYITI